MGTGNPEMELLGFFLAAALAMFACAPVGGIVTLILDALLLTPVRMEEDNKFAIFLIMTFLSAVAIFFGTALWMKSKEVLKMLDQKTLTRLAFAMIASPCFIIGLMCFTLGIVVLPIPAVSIGSSAMLSIPGAALVAISMFAIRCAMRYG